MKWKYKEVNRMLKYGIKEFLNARLPICDTYIEEKLCLMK